jgi:GT2 family glycosyltransferase
MSGPLDLSIVILSWNTRELLRACLESLQRDRSRFRREIIVVDNASQDGSADMVRADFPEVVLIANSANLLYAEGNNEGARRASGRYLCLLNSDTEVRPESLDRLLEFLQAHDDCAMVGPKLVNPDGSLQRGCNRFPGLLDPLLDSTPLGSFAPGRWWVDHTRMRDFDHAHSKDIDQPSGACMMVRREEFLAQGGLDPALSLFFNDVDLCLRWRRQGRRIHYLASAEVLHHAGASTKKYIELYRNALWFRNRATFYRKHYGAFGRAWLRIIMMLWAARVELGIRLGKKGRAAKVTSLQELRAHVKSCLSEPRRAA